MPQRGEREQQESAVQRRPHLALALGGGAARGLAHIGVLEVLQSEGLKPDSIAGTSMGALIGGLAASGIQASDILRVARDFHFPRYFVPGGLLRWKALFGAAIPKLAATFEQLAIPLTVTAANLEAGTQVLIRHGDLRSAIEASSSVPGVMHPVRHEGRWLVDGGILNPLPVDVAWMVEPDLVVGVDLSGSVECDLRLLRSPAAKIVARVGEFIPNPLTAKLAFEIMVRASEIMLDRQTMLAAAMTSPDVLVRPALGDIGLRDFHRLEDAVSAGRRAARAALPELRRQLDLAAQKPASRPRDVKFWFDPVCAMVVSPGNARAETVHGGTTYHFCSPNCRDCFLRNPAAYVSRLAVEVSKGPLL